MGQHAEWRLPYTLLYKQFFVCVDKCTETQHCRINIQPICTYCFKDITSIHCYHTLARLELKPYQHRIRTDVRLHICEEEQHVLGGSTDWLNCSEGDANCVEKDCAKRKKNRHFQGGKKYHHALCCLTFLSFYNV